jgi:hypothetical protein
MNSGGEIARQTERIAENQLVFRRLNEAMNGAGRSSDDHVFICECWDSRCRVTIRIELAEYRQVRENARYFLVAPGHESTPVAESSRVVRFEASYTVTEKLGYAGALAAADRAKSTL